MKTLSVISIALFLVSLTPFAKAEQKLPIGQTRCKCTFGPGNFPGVGLLHESAWGSSMLRLFFMGDYHHEPRAAEDACKQLLAHLQEIGICGRQETQ